MNILLQWMKKILLHCYTFIDNFQVKNVFFLSESNQASTLANSITGVTSKVMVTIFGGENPTRVMVLLPSPCALPTQGGAVVWAAVVDAVHVGHQNLNTRVGVLFSGFHEKAKRTSPCSPRTLCSGRHPARSFHRTFLWMIITLLKTQVLSTNYHQTVKILKSPMWSSNCC